MVVTGLPCRELQPRVYRDAVYGLNGRALVFCAAADRLVPAYDYYCTKTGQGRADCWYRQARATDSQTVEDTSGHTYALRARRRLGGPVGKHKFGAPDLQQVVLSK